MPEIKTIHDRNSNILPTTAELLASSKKGHEGEGMNKNDCTELNETQGHIADIKEHTDAEKLADMIRAGMMDNDDAEISRLDRTERGSWPDITEI